MCNIPYTAVRLAVRLVDRAAAFLQQNAQRTAVLAEELENVGDWLVGLLPPCEATRDYQHRGWDSRRHMVFGVCVREQGHRGKHTDGVDEWT